MTTHDTDNSDTPVEAYDDPDQEVELGDIDARMDKLEAKLERMNDDQEHDAAVDSNVLADEQQLDDV